MSQFNKEETKSQKSLRIHPLDPLEKKRYRADQFDDEGMGNGGSSQQRIKRMQSARDNGGSIDDGGQKLKLKKNPNFGGQQQQQQTY